MSLNIEWRSEDALGFPRVSGDEPFLVSATTETFTVFPA